LERGNYGRSPSPTFEPNEAQKVRSQAHRYRGSFYLRIALCYFQNQKVEQLVRGNTQGFSPRRLKHLQHESGNVKRFMQEVQRRYAVVDRAYGAMVTRKNGRKDRVAS
jgi:hypothetical protein